MQNIVILAGHIGQTPEVRNTNGGTQIGNFSLATSRPRYNDGKPVKDDQGRRVQDTEWHRITVFNGLAKTVEKYCDKGMKVLVRGRIHYSKWTDKDGVERYSSEIIAETVDFLSRAKPTEAGSTRSEEIDDEIPF